jgi:hypothetical protein
VQLVAVQAELQARRARGLFRPDDLHQTRGPAGVVLGGRNRVSPGAARTAGIAAAMRRQRSPAQVAISLQTAVRPVIVCAATRNTGAGRQDGYRRRQRWWTSTRVC